MADCSSRAPPPVPDVATTEWDAIKKRDILDYDAETDTYRASFDSAKETVCMAVIAVVAVVSDTSPAELPPIQSVIDTDAFDQLIESAATGPSTGDIHVSFTFAGCSVTVHSYGIIAVHPLHEEPVD